MNYAKAAAIQRAGDYPEETDQQIASRFGIGRSTVQRFRALSRMPTSALEAMAQTYPVGQVVYFIQADRFVKIGTAQDLSCRIAQLQTGCPFELKLLGWVDGGIAREAALHHQFRALAYRGEWFHYRDPLRSWITANSANPC